MDKDKLWQQTLNKLKPIIAHHNFRAWIIPISVRSFDGATLTLAVRDAFGKNNLIDKFHTLLTQTVSDITQTDIQIQYLIDPSLSPKKTSSSSGEGDFFLNYTHKRPTQTTGLNPKYTLQNFVVGLTNNLAFAAAQAVAQNPGTSYNPLFIYGPSGVGKTHLMHAIGNAILQKNPDAKVLYAPSEQFMNDFIDSIKNHSTTEFRKKYRSISLLLLDDVQFIAGKDSTQQEFFHTYNELTASSAQIVLTSDKPPEDMQQLESRLASRFKAGLTVDLQLPDYDTRVAILRAKLSERGESLPEDCLHLIAESIPSNTRELEGKLISVMSLLKLTGQAPSIEFIKSQLPQINTPVSKTDHKQLLSTINKYFNLRMADLTGPRRQKQLVMPRQIAMFLLYEDCQLPFSRVGEILGGRDHTTILYGVEKIKQTLTRDHNTQRIINEIRRDVFSGAQVR